MSIMAMPSAQQALEHALEVWSIDNPNIQILHSARHELEQLILKGAAQFNADTTADTPTTIATKITVIVENLRRLLDTSALFAQGTGSRQKNMNLAEIQKALVALCPLYPFC